MCEDTEVMVMNINKNDNKYNNNNDVRSIPGSYQIYNHKIHFILTLTARSYSTKEINRCFVRLRFYKNEIGEWINK